MIIRQAWHIDFGVLKIRGRESKFEDQVSMQYISLETFS